MHDDDHKTVTAGAKKRKPQPDGTLELRRQRDGTLRPYWYGRFMVDGRRLSATLGPVLGSPHPSGSVAAPGNDAFEKSRLAALKKLAVKVAEAREKRDAAHWVKRLHQLQHGAPLKTYPVAQLIEAWERLPRRKARGEMNAGYVSAVHATLRRFIAYVETSHPHIKEVGQVTRLVASGFMASDEAVKLSAKTRNDWLKRMRAVFRSLLAEDYIARNPFEGIPLHQVQHVHRRPLSAAEVEGVLLAVAKDDFTRPLIVCALSTALRRGDCCLLRWADVHLDERTGDGAPSLDHVRVKTSKTGETITAPIDARLKPELLRARALPGPLGEFVWPEQAAMIRHNPDGVTLRIQAAFARAGLESTDTHVDRARGMRRASVVDFHSLRTTWITDRLSEGIPIEAVKRTSGHRTTDVVTEHYYKPGDQQHLRTLAGSGVAVPSRDARMLEILRGMTADTWKRDRKQLEVILTGGPGSVRQAGGKTRKGTKRVQPEDGGAMSAAG